MPTIETRAEQPYVAITATVTMSALGQVLPPLTPAVDDWLRQRGVAPAGPPFWKYDVIDMAGELTVEVGVAVATTVTGDDRVQAGVLPAGRYATVLHVGHPATLMDATAQLLAWAEAQHLTWDNHDDHWGCRLEEYLTDPSEEPDLDKWQTRLAFRLATGPSGFAATHRRY